MSLSPRRNADLHIRRQGRYRSRSPNYWRHGDRRRSRSINRRRYGDRRERSSPRDPIRSDDLRRRYSRSPPARRRSPPRDRYRGRSPRCPVSPRRVQKASPPASSGQIARSRKRSSSPPQQSTVTIVAKEAPRSGRRAWKFDSPPRDETKSVGAETYGKGMGIVTAATPAGPFKVDGEPGQISRHLGIEYPASPMGVMAHSLNLTPEQQKAARELYIGNLPPDLDLNQLIEFLNAALLTIKVSPWPGTPVVRVWFAERGNYAYAELRTIEETTLALSMNGMSCLGYSLRIGRPRVYPSEYESLINALPADVPAAGPPPSPAAALAAATAAAAGVGSGRLPGFMSNFSNTSHSAMLAAQAAAAGLPFPRRIQDDRPERLVLLDLPPTDGCSEAEIKKLLTNFGTLKVFQYFEVPSCTNSAELSGVCIFEYSDIAQERSMVTALEHRPIGGEIRQVVKAEAAIRDGRLAEVIKVAAAAGAEHLQDELGWELMKPQVATRCIVLANLVTRNELKDDKEYYDIVDDVNQECSQFGEILNVEVPRPLPGIQSKEEEIDESDVGYAFVEFSTIEAAGAARKSLSGRKFAGRTVEAQYFSEILFKERKFKNPQANYDPNHSSAKNAALLPPPKQQS